MSYLFGRSCTLSMTGAASSPQPTQEGPIWPDLKATVTLSTQLSGQLRIAFQVESDTTGEANKAKLSLYNLSVQTRGILAKGSTIKLQAGYTQNIGVIFSGAVAKVTTKQDGPDVVTELEAGDGEPLLTYGSIQKSYATAVTPSQVVVDIARALQVQIAEESVRQLVGTKAQAQLLKRQFSRGYVMSGSCSAELDKLLHPLGLQWFVLNGVLHVLGASEPITQQAVVLSADTGLVGVPSRNENSAVTAQCLLNPSIFPGTYVQIVSKQAAQSGFFKVDKLTIAGDTHGDPWTMDMEAVPA